MIIGDNRERVIQNIKAATEKQTFNAKVEVGDPVMPLKESTELVEQFWADKHKLSNKVNNVVGRILLNLLSSTLTGSTEFDQLDRLQNLPKGGAIVTANHFNQIDCLAVNQLARKKHRKLTIAIEETNLKLPNILGYLMKYIGTIPLVKSTNYIGVEFPKHVQDALTKNNWVIIFPEQEMWWNYRKPRPLQRGAYFYAAKLNVPVISTFVEIQNLPKPEKADANFNQTKYVVHVLETIYPDPNLSVRQNSERMMKQDYDQKVAAYEKAYGKKLDYTFTPWDIAGWHPKNN